MMPKAEQHFREALTLQRKLVDQYPAVPSFRKVLAMTHHNLAGLLSDMKKDKESEEQYRLALDLDGKLVNDFPTVPEYRQDLALCWYNLGDLLKERNEVAKAEECYQTALDIYYTLSKELSDVYEFSVDLGGRGGSFALFLLERGKAEESLLWNTRSIAALRSVHSRGQGTDRSKDYLRNDLVNRAQTYDLLKRHLEAAKDWDAVIALCPKDHQMEILRLKRIRSRLRAGMVSEAVAEVEELTRVRNWGYRTWYAFAINYAIASEMSADEKQEYANRAMEMLGNAVKAGFTEAAELKKDADLKPLREREDFKKLLAELEEKAKTGPETSPPPGEKK